MAIPLSLFKGICQIDDEDRMYSCYYQKNNYWNGWLQPYLNKANVIVHTQRLAIGGIGGVVVDIRIILKQALQLCATGLIVAHNHPSGNLIPSDADVAITKKLKEAAALMDITLFDHVIVSGTANTYYSFADNWALKNRNNAKAIKPI